MLKGEVSKYSESLCASKHSENSCRIAPYFLWHMGLPPLLNREFPVFLQYCFSWANFSGCLLLVIDIILLELMQIYADYCSATHRLESRIFCLLIQRYSFLPVLTFVLNRMSFLFSRRPGLLWPLFLSAFGVWFNIRFHRKDFC